MLQQTTVAAVGPYFRKFLDKWPDVHALAAARDDEVMAAWAGLGYYARARNLLACARMISAQNDGQFPTTTTQLRALPGIGPYTAAAIASIAFDRPETVVDGNVERVMARLHDIHTPLPAAKPELTQAAAHFTPMQRAGDYAQAVMDLGATICTPRSPACGICPVMAHCQARKHGDPSALPKKTPKKPKPIRLGHVYIGRTADDAWLVERRPPKGLLGGMLGWPTTDWDTEIPAHKPPSPANWTAIGLEARHTFTHFHLRLEIHCALLPKGVEVAQGYLTKPGEFDGSELPTAMRKAYDLAISWDGWT